MCLQLFPILCLVSMADLWNIWCVWWEGWSYVLSVSLSHLFLSLSLSLISKYLGTKTRQVARTKTRQVARTKTRQVADWRSFPHLCRREAAKEERKKMGTGGDVVNPSACAERVLPRIRRLVTESISSNTSPSFVSTTTSCRRIWPTAVSVFRVW